MVFTGLLEELLDALCAHSYEHLIEVRAGAENKIASSFAGDGSRKEGLACSRLTKQHDTFEQLGSLI